MALRSTTVFLVLGSSSVLAQNITCPILNCEDQSLLTPGVCFEHDGNVPTRKLVGALCPSSQANPMYCPFELGKNEYSWVEEYLQGQDIKDVNVMKCNA